MLLLLLLLFVALIAVIDVRKARRASPPVWPGVALAAAVFVPAVTAAQPFTDLGAGLPGVSSGAVAWADIDGDGDLDLFLMGNTDAEYLSRIYRNDAGTFTDLGAGLPGTTRGAAAWADFDGDGDPDLALTGMIAGGTRIARIFRNDGGSFTDVGAGLTGVYLSAVAWGDYDGDGDPDLVLSGHSGPTYITRIYRNDAGTFTNAGAGLPGLEYSSMAWGDYDGDGDLDLAVAGTAGACCTSRVARIYRNDAGTFTNSGISLAGVYFADVAWGDYDLDGDPDLLLVGGAAPESLSRIYRNEGGTFVNSGISLPGVTDGSVAWGDFDADGDLDFALMGDTGPLSVSRIYENGLDPILCDSPQWDGAVVTHEAQHYLRVTSPTPGCPLGWVEFWNTSANLSIDGLFTSPDEQAFTDVVASGAYGAYAGTDAASCRTAEPSLGNCFGYAVSGGPGAEALYVRISATSGTNVQFFLAASNGATVNLDPVLTLPAEGRAEMPEGFALTSVYPNPFNPRAAVAFAVPVAGHVRLAAFDVLGREVAVLVDGVVAAGRHEAVLEGAGLPSGVYVVRLAGNGAVAARSVTLLK